jgi:CheY-like chemotaxis protein
MKKAARILVVDDEQEMLNGCSKILQALGYRPFPVQSGKLALELLRAEEFDLVLCDLLMPDLDGMQILQSAIKYASQTPFV